MASTATNTITPNERLGRVPFNEFFAAALEYKTNTDWQGDKRFYVTFLPNASSSFVSFGSITDRREVINYNIRTKLTGSFPNGSGDKTLFRKKSLAELSTAEIIGHDSSSNQLTLSNKTPLLQNYLAQQHGGEALHNHPFTPPKFEDGSYLISKITDDNPSLLLELNKDAALPNGLGDKEFIVIPENLHPYVKDNLEYFLTRAGINISGDASQYIKLDETNRNLL